MKKTKSRQSDQVLTSRRHAKLQDDRGRIASELPDLLARDQMRKEAREELTLSGELRRAIHGSGSTLAEIAGLSGITPIVLDEFLTGERNLRSDVMDRLAGSLGLALSQRA